MPSWVSVTRELPAGQVRVPEKAGVSSTVPLRSVTVTSLQLQMLIATGDPADTAQRYGQTIMRMTVQYDLDI